MPSLVPVFERVGSSCLEHLDTLVCDAGTGDKAYLSAMNVRGKTMILKDVIFFKCPQGASSTLGQCLKDEGLDLYLVQLQDEMLCVFGDKGTQFACVMGIVASVCNSWAESILLR